MTGDHGKRAGISVATDVVYETLDDEAVLLDLKTGVYFMLNEVGTRIWHLINQHGDVSRIRDELTAEYDVEPESLDRDLNDLIVELAKRGLISRDDPDRS